MSQVGHSITPGVVRLAHRKKLYMNLLDIPTDLPQSPSPRGMGHNAGDKSIPDHARDRLANVVDDPGKAKYPRPVKRSTSEKRRIKRGRGIEFIFKRIMTARGEESFSSM